MASSLLFNTVGIQLKQLLVTIRRCCIHIVESEITVCVALNYLKKSVLIICSNEPLDNLRSQCFLQQLVVKYWVKLLAKYKHLVWIGYFIVIFMVTYLWISTGILYRQIHLNDYVLLLLYKSNRSARSIFCSLSIA